jgi:uncharacterized protein YcbK (DUF882 family)
MFKFVKRNQQIEANELAHSRRSFMSRLAFGTALSIAIPEVVLAAKHVEVKQNKLQTSKSTVRLPKEKLAPQLNHAKTSRLPASTAHSQQLEKPAHLATSKVNHHSRVHDQLANKKTSAHTAEHGKKAHPAIHTQAKTRNPESFVFNESNYALSQRSVALQNPWTGDKLDLTYYEQGRYLEDALQEISVVLRDHHTGDVHPIDPALLDQLHDIKQMLGLDKPFNIVCGYRSPLTNAMLHAENAGVASNSFHIHGRAIDIRLERYDLGRLHNAALAMHRGGVGYYPKANFLHLDTGNVRNWRL